MLEAARRVGYGGDLSFSVAVGVPALHIPGGRPALERTPLTVGGFVKGRRCVRAGVGRTAGLPGRTEDALLPRVDVYEPHQDVAGRLGVLERRVRTGQRAVRAVGLARDYVLVAVVEWARTDVDAHRTTTFAPGQLRVRPDVILPYLVNDVAGRGGNLGRGVRLFDQVVLLVLALRLGSLEEGRCVRSVGFSTCEQFHRQHVVSTCPVHPQVRSEIDRAGFPRRRPGWGLYARSGVQPAVFKTLVPPDGLHHAPER